MPVEKFYNYRSSDTDPKGWYSSYGPASALERAETSILYLYRGPKGTSLVFMHGKRGSDGGGSVTFHITGLPDDGEWAVTDDQYDASTNYDTFDESDGEWDVDWTWASDSKHGGGADGGAFRGLTPDDRVKIDPAFNESARLYGRHTDRDYEGNVERWNALAADSRGSGWAFAGHDETGRHPRRTVWRVSGRERNGDDEADHRYRRRRNRDGDDD